MNGDYKVSRIRRRHAAELNLLTDVTRTAQEAIPKLRTEAENRVAFRNMADSMSALGKHCRTNGFDPTRTFQHVANISTPIWTLILDMFAKYDPETGELMDDGLLYKMDDVTNTLKINKPFFYAIVADLEAAGIPTDMRGKIKIS